VPLVIVFTKFDEIVSDVSLQDEIARMTYYEGVCRSLFGNERTNIVSSNYSLVCVVEIGRLTPFFVFSTPEVS
jgi:hypothetical protein